MKSGMSKKALMKTAFFLWLPIVIMAYGFNLDTPSYPFKTLIEIVMFFFISRVVYKFFERREKNQ